MSNIKKIWRQSYGLVTGSDNSKEMLIHKIVSNFEKENHIKFSDIDTLEKPGKQLRDKLLIALKESKHLSYKDINEIEVFKRMKIGTLRTIFYRKKTSDE